MKILGIDPGTTRIGYGIIRKRSDLELINYGVIEIKARDSFGRLFELGNRLVDLIDEHKPDLAGVEKLYFAKNQKTALSVSEARGVIIYTLLKKNIEVREFRPGDVKLAVANYGLAEKQAVAIMVKKILKIDSLKGHDDASDALAIAITAFYSKNFSDNICVS